MKACKDLGADVAINYKTEDFVARVKEETGGKGDNHLTQKLTFQSIVLGDSSQILMFNLG